jgi:D-beta-D-heptose 7-phosphate kinase/D-beta-D-heptose 1-phosphate adenosyltransferase
MDSKKSIQHKIIDRADFSTTRHRWKFLGDRIVFTNGCFDILHPGHIHVLSSAKAEGTRLVVGLNSDDSVGRLKGESRPINGQDDRALMLAALHAVDAVIYFEEDTPLELIEEIKPDVLVKGGDYKEDEVVGADVVKGLGGKVVIIDFLDGYSTTSLLEKDV